MSKRVAKADSVGGASEDFPTPLWCVERLLETADLPVGGRWLEPAAGDGNIIRAVNASRFGVGIVWTACDIRPECEAPLAALGAKVAIRDFLEPVALVTQRPRPFDVAILNPPFSRAQEFVHACRMVATTVVCLVRLNWLGSDKRDAFFQTGMPVQIFVLPNRPSFSSDGKTDSAEYAWMIWDWSDRSSSEIRRLALTPKSDRARAKSACP